MRENARENKEKMRDIEKPISRIFFMVGLVGFEPTTIRL